MTLANDDDEYTPTLTLNDIAAAWFACGHAASWWKKSGASTSYAKAEIAKYEALGKKLTKILDHFECKIQPCPPEGGGDVAGDDGDTELILFDYVDYLSEFTK